MSLSDRKAASVPHAALSVERLAELRGNVADGSYLTSELAEATAQAIYRCGEHRTRRGPLQVTLVDDSTLMRRVVANALTRVGDSAAVATANSLAAPLARRRRDAPPEQRAVQDEHQTGNVVRPRV